MRRAVGSNFPLVRRVIELGRPILENVRGARRSASARGVWGHAPPGKFLIFGPSEIVSSAILVRLKRFRRLKLLGSEVQLGHIDVRQYGGY